MSKNRLKRYNKEVLDKIGYQPISSSIKPVHIANGLFRFIIGEEYDIESLNKWAKRHRDGKEINSAEQIKKEYESVLDDGISLEEINELRHFIGLIFNADRAATPSVKFSTLTIASKTQITNKVQNEFDIPKFLYSILYSKLDEKHSPCIDLIKSYLHDESDELSRIAQPIVSINSAAKKGFSNDVDEIKLVGVELRIREAFDRLAINNVGGNKLLFLERIVLYSCFAIILHLSSRVLDISEKYTEEDRIPLLFDADGSLEAVKLASQETLLLSKLGLEEYFEKSIELILHDEQYHTLSKDEILKTIEEAPLADSNKNDNTDSDDKKRDEYKNLFLGFYEESKDTFDAIVKATTYLIFSEVYSSTTDPARCMIHLGAKIGLITPRAGGRGRRRFSPDPIILEILILSLLEKDEKLKLGEFAQRLWTQFGIIIGGNPDEDIDKLSKWNISQSIPGDLARDLSINAEKIAETYISMGYGKRYADGVTMLSISGGI